MDKVKIITRQDVSFAVYENESPAIADFWQWDEWEKYTYKYLKHFLDKDHSYIDIGVHLGQTILFGSQLCKTCYAIEPDPEAIRIIKRNIDLNDFSNIDLITKAVGEDNKTIKLGCPETCPDLGSSRTSQFFAEEANSFKVQSISLPTLIKEKEINDLNFIKIDVEGMEDTIIDTMWDIHVPIFVEMHTPWLSQGKEGFDKIMKYLERYNQIYLFMGGEEKPINSVTYISQTLYFPEENPKGDGFYTILAFNVDKPQMNRFH